MSVGFDPSTDFETIADGLEAVTLDRRGSSSNVSVTKALKRQVSTTEIAASDGKLQSGDTRWHLPTAEVTSPPRLGDWIQDSGGDRYQILEFHRELLGSRYRCIARNLRVAYGLDDTLTIQQATYAKGTGGASEETFTTWRTGVRARIQEVAADVTSDVDARRTEKMFTVMLEDDYSLGHRHRLRDRHGNLYKVQGTTSKAELGKPFTVEAIPWLS
jgi:hypothetical protein